MDSAWFTGALQEMLAMEMDSCCITQGASPQAKLEAYTQPSTLCEGKWGL